jgi:predicted dehydrogenase
MNAVAAAAPDRVFTMHFNRRLDPFVLKLRELLAAGEAGTVTRVNWTVTNWFRTDSYYASAAWRGTWAGEGGGVLINQCIHDLDCWQLLFGLPARTRAFCRFGKHHRIEVEDEVTAFFEYPDGLTGVFIAGTGEAPGTSRLEIACTRGRIVVENRQIRFQRTTVPVDEFNRTNASGFGEPECWACEVPVAGKTDFGSAILANFVEAVLGRAPLIVPGEEGLASMEMENAMLLSTWTDAWAAIPVDDAAFDRELKKRIAGSTKLLQDKAQVLDLNQSFK